MTFRFTVLALLALSACEESGPCRLSVLATIPFDVEHHHLIVQARLNGHPSNLVFDTGSQTSVLTDAAVDRLGLRLEPTTERTVGGIGGRRVASLVAADTFTISNLDGRDFHFLNADVFGDRKAPFDGLLSTDFLSRYDVDLDVPAKRIGFYQPSGDCSRPTVALTGDVGVVPLLPNDEADSRPRIELSIDGKPVNALLDTGASNSVIFRPAARRVGLPIAALQADRVGRLGGIGPRPVVAYRHIVQAVRIGDLTIDNMPIEVADEDKLGEDDMLLGLDFITRVHLWLSISSGRLVINFPPLPSPFDQRPQPRLAADQ